MKKKLLRSCLLTQIYIEVNGEKVIVAQCGLETYCKGGTLLEMDEYADSAIGMKDKSLKTGQKPKYIARATRIQIKRVFDRDVFPNKGEHHPTILVKESYPLGPLLFSFAG